MIFKYWCLWMSLLYFSFLWIKFIISLNEIYDSSLLMNSIQYLLRLSIYCFVTIYFRFSLERSASLFAGDTKCFQRLFNGRSWIGVYDAICLFQPRTRTSFVARKCPGTCGLMRDAWSSCGNDDGDGGSHPRSTPLRIDAAFATHGKFRNSTIARSAQNDSSYAHRANSECPRFPDPGVWPEISRGARLLSTLPRDEVYLRRGRNHSRLSISYIAVDFMRLRFRRRWTETLSELDHSVKIPYRSFLRQATNYYCFQIFYITIYLI